MSELVERFLRQGRRDRRIAPGSHATTPRTTPASRNVPRDAWSTSRVSTIGAFFVARLVLAYPPTAYDPEVSGRIRMLESAQKRSNGIVELTERRFTANAEHRDAGGFHRIKAQWIREIGIKAHKKSLLTDANGEELLICRARQPLLVDRRDVVPSCPEGFCGALSQILVEFDPHATSTKGPEARRAP